MNPCSIATTTNTPPPNCEYIFSSARICAAVVFAHLNYASIAPVAASENELTSNVRTAWATPPIPKSGGTYRVGNPYVIGGRTYIPREQPNYRAKGVASWYGGKFHGRLTANGEIYDMNALSAAHPTLPLPSYVRVTNLDNRRSIIVRLNDRGPYHDNRLIDLSVRAAKLLGYYDQGLAQVRVEYIGPADLDRIEYKKLAATLRHDDPSSDKTPTIVPFHAVASDQVMSLPRPTLTLSDRTLSPADDSASPAELVDGFDSSAENFIGASLPKAIYD